MPQRSRTLDGTDKIDFWLLYELIKSNRKQEIKKLIKERPEILFLKHTDRNFSILHVAAQYGNSEIFKEILANIKDSEKKDELFFLKTIDGSTTLHIAAQKGNSEIFKEILKSIKNDEQKARFIFETMNGGETALFVATQEGHLGIVKEILANIKNPEKKAELITKKTNKEETILHFAAKGGYLEVVNIILENIKNNPKKNELISTETNYGVTALAAAVGNEHKKIVETLITNGANVNARQYNITTVLHLAAKKGYKEIAETLIANGADVNAQEISGFTIIDTAAFMGHEKIVKLLIEKEKDLDLDLNNLQHFIYKNSHDCFDDISQKYFKTFVEAFNEIEQETGDKSKRQEFFNKEFKTKFQIKIKAGEGEAEAEAESTILSTTILDLAILRQNYSLAELFIGNGADVNKQTNGTTPLYKALDHDDIDYSFIKFLITNQAKLTEGEREVIKVKLSRLEEGDQKQKIQTALDIIENPQSWVEEESATAIKASKLKSLETSELKWLNDYFIQNPRVALDKLSRKEVGRTPLHAAAENPNHQTLLMNMVCSIDVYNKSNPKTLLSLDEPTAMYENPALKKILNTEIHNTEIADNITSKRNLVTGVTPLYLAVMGSNLTGAKVLIRYGANINASATREDGNKKTILELAIEKGNLKMVQLLAGDNSANKKADLSLPLNETAITALKEPKNVEILEFIKKQYPEKAEALSRSLNDITEITEEFAQTSISPITKSTGRREEGREGGEENSGAAKYGRRPPPSIEQRRESVARLGDSDSRATPLQSKGGGGRAR
jgi:cytohesin